MTAVYVGEYTPGICRCGCGQPTKLVPKTVTRLGQIKGQPFQYIDHHTPGPLDRILGGLILGGPDGHWMWGGTIDASVGGYGKVTVQGKRYYAHRLSYEVFVGPIPEGLEIDHLCRVKACVRPDHLEAVTGAENVRRAAVMVTHCPRNHPYDEANTYLRPGGSRKCRTCNRERVAAHKAARRAA